MVWDRVLRGTGIGPLSGVTMEIHRQGANHKEGWTRLGQKKSTSPALSLSVPIQSPGTSITGPGPVVLIQHRRCRHRPSSGEYDYRIEMELDELAALIDMLASKGLEQFGDSLSQALSGSVRSLNRLTAAASGISVKDEKP